jgi:hypothetical protein
MESLSHEDTLYTRIFLSALAFQCLNGKASPPLSFYEICLFRLHRDLPALDCLCVAEHHREDPITEPSFFCTPLINSIQSDILGAAHTQAL